MHARVAVLFVAGVLAVACQDNRAPQLGEEIERGKQLYAANGCGTCHGMQGKGDGPVAVTLKPPPSPIASTTPSKSCRCSRASQ